MKNKAKEILTYTLLNDYANKAGNNTLYVHVPLNNDYTDMLDAIAEIEEDSKDQVLFIATTIDGYRQVRADNYNAVYLYDIFTYDLEGRLVLSKNIPISARYLLLQSCDNFNYDEISTILGAIRTMSRSIIKSYVLYDGLLPKKMLGGQISELMYRMRNYEIDGVGRDKIHTSVTLFKLKNKLREKKLNLSTYLDTITNVEPYLTVTRLNDLDIHRFVNINVPIITMTRDYILELTRLIRNNLGFISDVPYVNEWLALHKPGIAYSIKDNTPYTLPTGYRFKIKSIVQSADGNVLTVTFDHKTHLNELVECVIHLSMQYIDILLNDMPATVEQLPLGVYYAYFGYVLGYWHTIDVTFDKGIVVYNKYIAPTPESLYSSINPIQSSLNLVLVNN